MAPLRVSVYASGRRGVRARGVIYAQSVWGNVVHSLCGEWAILIVILVTDKRLWPSFGRFLRGGSGRSRCGAERVLVRSWLRL